MFLYTVLIFIPNFYNVQIHAYKCFKTRPEAEPNIYLDHSSKSKIVNMIHN